MSEYKGLSASQVEKSRQEHGINILPPPPRKSLWRLYLEKFKDPIIRILLIAAALSLVVSVVHNEYAETIGIICAILLATSISFWFEYDAMKKFEVLNTINDDISVKVIRDGNVTEIPRKDVVVGDIVLLESGEEIPADGLLLEAVSLRVNESTLTGELQIGKTTDPAAFNKDATYPSNMVLKGTTVTEGYGTMEVRAVGAATEIGKVARESTAETDEQTPLNQQLGKLSKIIGRGGQILAGGTFLVLVLKGFFFGGELLHADALTIADELLKYFMVAVTLIVVAVPEGLPMSVTLSLAVNMRRMLANNNLVRKLHASETMGAVTVICTDKTGTLTQNIMRVGEDYFAEGTRQDLTAAMMAVNSTAFLDSGDKVIGNPTEGALLLWLKDNGFDYLAIRDEAGIIDRMPFTTERKYMATLADIEGYGRLLLVKGAPEIVMEMSGDIPAEFHDKVTAKLAEYQGRAMRTLGFGYASCPGVSSVEEALAGSKLIFTGVTAISDPVRTDVPGAVEDCLAAGIDVKIVTGDTPATATEIARLIGLWTEYDTEENRITGAEFAALSDEELLLRVRKLKVISRARPMDKQRLVRLLQQCGEVVGVTGDGTNDAPALNYAQVGMSMGSGTSVAKEASDITLLDDSFASVATAVMWGRSLYRNIQRFVMFQLTINVVAVVVTLIGSIFGAQLPLTVTQMLWVNIIMDTFAALAFASLPPTRSVMTEPPRRSTDFIVPPKMGRTILGTAAVFIAVLLGMLVWFGSDVTPYQLTIFFTVFVMLQFWNMFNARRFASTTPFIEAYRGCGAFFAVLAAILFGQVIIVNYGGDVFRTVPLSVQDWLIIFAATSIVAWVGELFRALKKAWKSNPSPDKFN